MITMNPVVLHGRTVWDQRYFPRDEHEDRLLVVQAATARRGLSGLVVFGHYTDYGNLCYLTQHFPMMSWPALAVVPAEGAITLIPSVGGGRDIPATKARSWVEDVRAIKTLGTGLRTLLAERGIEGQVGLVGMETCLAAPLYDEVRDALTDIACVPADDLMADIRRSLRPREVSALREAARIVRAAADAMASAHANGASNAAALVEAERTARRLGVNDFRGLANLDPGGELRPFEELIPFRTEPLFAYLAVSFLGYWADLGITVGGRRGALVARAERALGTVMSCIVAGAKASALAQRLADELGDAEAGRAQRYGLGNGIGLGLDSPPNIAPESEDVLAEHAALSLRLRLDDNSGQSVLVSDLVLVTAAGAESLFPAADRQF